jgi:hypothetical protein
MEKLEENDITYFYHRHVVIVITAVTTISLPPVSLKRRGQFFRHAGVHCKILKCRDILTERLGIMYVRNI